MQDSTHLAAAVGRRMDELGLTPTTFARATGLTAQGLSPLRAGERKRYQKRLTNEVCRVFGWSSDSITRLLAGQPEVIEGEPDLSRLDDDVARRVTELEQDLAQLIQQLRDEAGLALEYRRRKERG